MNYAIEIPFQDADGRPIYVRVSKARFEATEKCLQQLRVHHGTLLTRNSNTLLLGLLSSHVLINEPVEGGDPTAFRGAVVVD